MTKEQLYKLIAQGEGQYLEFKNSQVKPAKLAYSLVAFANTNAGKVIIGIDDKTRKPTGMRNKEEVLDNIHRAASLDCCEPAVSISVEEDRYEGEPVFLITIPYQYEFMFTTDGKVLIRRGTENITASSHEINTLSSKRGRLKYESQIILESPLEDLDMSLVEEYREIYRSVRHRSLVMDDIRLLESIGSIKKEGDKFKPTVAGLLFFGRKHHNFLPQNYLTIVRYPNKEISRSHLDSRQFEGTLPEIINQAIGYISDHIHIGSIKDVKRFGAKREDIPEYPFQAIRELIINAIAHREYASTGSRVLIKWFTDRMEISNPGTFVEPVTADNIYISNPAHRNPNIMKTLYGYGYTEGYGDGMSLIKKEFENHPLKPELPEFKEVPGGVLVTIYAADLSKLEDEKVDLAKLELKERQIKALEYIRGKGRITNKEYRELCSIGTVTAKRDLQDLVRKDLSEQKGKGRNTFYVIK